MKNEKKIPIKFLVSHTGRKKYAELQLDLRDLKILVEGLLNNEQLDADVIDLNLARIENLKSGRRFNQNVQRQWLVKKGLLKPVQEPEPKLELVKPQQPGLDEQEWPDPETASFNEMCAFLELQGWKSYAETEHCLIWDDPQSLDKFYTRPAYKVALGRHGG